MKSNLTNFFFLIIELVLHLYAAAGTTLDSELPLQSPIVTSAPEVQQPHGFQTKAARRR